MSSFFSGDSSDDGWFRVGNVEVTSSLLVAGLCALSMFVYAIDKTLLFWLWLISDGSPFAGVVTDGVRQGQVWRLVTWPMFNQPDIWTAIDIVIIWYIGKEIERQLGRRRYLWFLAVVVVVPAIAYVIVVPTLIQPTALIIGGAFYLSSAVIIAYIAAYPTSRSFFNVPFWVVAVVFEGITVLQLMGDRVWDGLFFLLVLDATALLASRSFGLSELEWIPRIPLPAALTGTSAPSRSARSKRARRSGPATVTPIRSSPTSADLLRQAEVDLLLDKINEHGINSLTAEERRRLDEHSRRMRDER